MTPPHIYGMFHVAGDGGSHVNLRAKGFDALRVYVRNAVTAARSAAAVGMNFALITNDVPTLEAVLEAEGLAGALTLRAHSFTRAVPRGPSRSSRSTFSAVKSRLQRLNPTDGQSDYNRTFGDLVALLDIDTIFQAPLTLADDALTAYDISDAVFPAYGFETIRRDLELLTAAPITPRWYGGEFIAGPPAAFAALAREIDEIWPRYCAALGTLHHTGDEAVVSAALCRLAAAGVPIFDAGKAGLITRYWSVRTLSKMRTLAQVSHAAILHLPADKHWLSSLADALPGPAQIVPLLRRHVARRRPREFLKQLAALARGRPLQNLPRLA